MYKNSEFMSRFKSVGSNVQIFEHALILKPEQITLADGVRIDDYARIEGGSGISIGECVHICSFASIYGGGSAKISDYCGISQGARLITGTEQLSAVMTAAAPNALRNPKLGCITMLPHSFVGANAVILPDVTIGEGAVIGAGAVVRKPVPPWTIMVGVPAKPVGTRPRLKIDIRKNE